MACHRAFTKYRIRKSGIKKERIDANHKGGVSGILLTTHISASWQLYLFYGVFTGIGTGGVYVPIVSTIAKWFTKKRATMTGIAISGMGFGTLLL